MIKKFLWPDDYRTNSEYTNNSHKIDELKMAITEYIRNVDRAILNTVFENTVRTVNKCLETGGDTLNITCNFLYCNYQVHKDFVITLCINIQRLEILVKLFTVKPRNNVTSFIAHTTLWTKNTYFTLSRFTAANLSGKTGYILNTPFMLCDAVD